MTLASSYNAAYITANGGTTASAFAALQSELAAGRCVLFLCWLEMRFVLVLKESSQRLFQHPFHCFSGR